jgi:hypothetical protein
MQDCKRFYDFKISGFQFVSVFHQDSPPPDRAALGGEWRTNADYITFNVNTSSPTRLRSCHVNLRSQGV